MSLKKIILYDEPSIAEINIQSLVSFLKKTIPVEVIVKDNFFSKFTSEQIYKISETRIFDINKKFEYYVPNGCDLESDSSNVHVNLFVKIICSV